MAVIWERFCDGQYYEVRRAGNTLRLYRDGVLHTQYNPRRTLTLGVWDLLLLPAFALTPAPQRILVLGVGGGAILRLLQQFFPGAQLSGVDIDRQHLTLATRFFGVDKQRVSLHQADARQWLADESPDQKFDLVIDDLFVGAANDPVRVFEADKPWFEMLLARIETNGALVLNFASMTGLSKSAWTGSSDLRRRLPGALALQMPFYGNAVGAFYRDAVDPALLRARLLANQPIARELQSGRFNASVKSLRVRR